MARDLSIRDLGDAGRERVESPWIARRAKRETVVARAILPGLPSSGIWTGAMTSTITNVERAVKMSANARRPEVIDFATTGFLLSTPSPMPSNHEYAKTKVRVHSVDETGAPKKRVEVTMSDSCHVHHRNFAPATSNG